MQTSYAYNTLNRLTSMTAVSGQQSALGSFSYELGAAGNRTSVTELSGRKATYAYDDLYRLTSETITSDPVAANNGSIGYGYDAVGNRLSRTSTLASDQYDANRSTISSGGNVYRYDFENRIIALNPGTPNAVTFLYDGDGNRVSRPLALAQLRSRQSSWLIRTTRQDMPR